MSITSVRSPIVDCFDDDGFSAGISSLEHDDNFSRFLPDLPFPHRRKKDSNRFQITVADYLVASREVGCSTEYYRHRSSKRIGLLAPT
jgi:hypothetical protein